MMKLDNNAADILSLDAGEVFVGGRYNSLIPLMQQLFEGIKYIDLNVLVFRHLITYKILLYFVFRWVY